MLLSIIHLLDADPAVSQITVDFEMALWSVLRRLFPGVKLLGCAFHWTQALWRKIQALGLQGAYNNDDAVHKYLRKIMALPFLPASKIPRVYRHLRPQAATAPLREFLAYVGDQWVYGSFFSPIDWSVYGQAVRTNNDIEGWHNRINRRANGKSQLPFYLLIGFFTRKHSSPPSMSDWFQKIN